MDESIRPRKPTDPPPVDQAEVKSAYIDPIKAGILADSIFAVVAAQREADLASYREMLKAHDWFFDYSDDIDAWKRGLAQRKQIKALANLLDADRAIWNSVAPAGYELKVAVCPAL